MRAIAAEVLARRGVQPAERAEHEPEREQRAAHGVVAREEADGDADDPDQHGQLDQRERVPRRLRALLERVQRCGAAPAAGPAERCSSAPAALALVCAGSRASSVACDAAYPRVGAAQRSNGHRRALHRPPAGDRAGPLPRHAGAGGDRPPAGRRGARVRAAARRRRCSACRCGGRSRWRGCGSARRRTTGRTRTWAGSSSRSSGILASLFVTLSLASRLDRLWRMVRRAAGHDQREGVLARIFGAIGGHRAGAVRRLVPGASRARRPTSADAAAASATTGSSTSSRPTRSRGSCCAQRDEERRRQPATLPPLDLSGAAWPGPPHPEAINAATFALRRAVNAYPDGAPLRAAIARDARHRSGAGVRRARGGRADPGGAAGGRDARRPRSSGPAGDCCPGWSARRGRRRSRWLGRAGAAARTAGRSSPARTIPPARSRWTIVLGDALADPGRGAGGVPPGRGAR